MPLAVTSLVAPELTLEALEAACRGRGLDGAEVVLGTAADVTALVSRVRAANARVVAIRIERPDAAHAGAVADASARLGAPVSIPRHACPEDKLTALANVFAHAGARLLIGQRTDLAEMVALADAIDGSAHRTSLGIAWELRPSTERLSEAGAVIVAAGERLGLVRLHGGGPEQRAQDGRGLGPLLVDLALSRFAGPIVLCPSEPAQLPRWRTWLASQASAGCGHGKDLRRLDVDVRDVEPKDRLETILGAYHALGPGAILHLTVDHDPSCMYYTLEATEPAGSFEFRTIEHGPEVWRAEVTRR